MAMEGNEAELLKEEGYALTGAAFVVYNHLEPGFANVSATSSISVRLRASSGPRRIL